LSTISATSIHPGKTLRALSKNGSRSIGGADLTFVRAAVTPQQIEDWYLPSRPTKSSDPRAKTFGDTSVELDAIDPISLREVVQSCIERHLPPEKYSVLLVAEQSERQLFRGLAGLVEKLRGTQ
jgi:hypothetical protein